MSVFPPLFSGLLVALLVLNQRTLFRTVLVRRFIAVLALAAALLAPKATFGYQVWLFWFIAVLFICALASLIWRRDRMLRQIWPLLDLAATGAFFAFTATSLAALIGLPGVAHPNNASQIACVYLAVAGCLHLFHELQRGNVLQRPLGLTFAQSALIAGALINVAAFPHLSATSFAFIVVGAPVMAARLQNFFHTTEESRVLARIAASDENLQPEYTAPSLECPEPRLWSMFESMTAEKEVLDLLYALVRATKPRVVVETGTFAGISSTYISRALLENGRGKLITCEMDPAAHATAAARFQREGLSQHIDLRLSSSFDLQLPDTIDMLYCDSDVNVREEEVRRFIDRVNPCGLILMHDAGSHFQVVRQGALRLEQEGLISVVLVSTPRGLVIAQKRHGRV